MSSDEDDRAPCVSPTSLLVPVARLTVAHPGITRNQFTYLFKSGYLPESIATAIRTLEDSQSNEKQITELWNHLNNFIPSTFEDLVALYKVTCALTLLDTSIDLIPLKINVVHNVYRQTANDWDINPVHIHVMCQELHPCLLNNRNLMYFARMTCTISRMSFYISVSLVWSSLLSLLGRDVNMYRLHDDMLDLLNDIDIPAKKSDSELFYSLLEIVAFLVNIIVPAKMDEMICTRFQRYFTSSHEQVDKLLLWAYRVKKAFSFSHAVENEDSIVITELLDFDIIPPLEDLLKEVDVDHIK